MAGVEIIAHLADMGLDAVEISGGIGRGNTVAGIRRPDQEAYFLPIARKARPMTDLPILLVGGLRSREVMDRVLDEGSADFISLCRPLIRELDDLFAPLEREPVDLRAPARESLRALDDRTVLVESVDDLCGADRLLGRFAAGVAAQWADARLLCRESAGGRRARTPRPGAVAAARRRLGNAASALLATVVVPGAPRGRCEVEKPPRRSYSDDSLE